MAGKYAVEQPKQAFLQEVSAILDHVCSHAINARALATFQALDAGRQLIKGDVTIQACIVQWVQYVVPLCRKSSMHRAAIHGIGILSSVVVFGLLFEIATSQKESSAVGCVRTEADGPCLYTHNLQHLTHRHTYEGHNVNVVEHLALLHAAQPDAELVPKATAVDKQTVEEYINDHIWARTASNKRFRKFLAGSPLFASTTAGARPGLVEWYYTQTDSLLEQPSAFLTEDSETLQWLPKDEEWAEVHRNYSMQMANSQEIDILLFGDSIFESTLGTSIGHQVRRAEGIPAVWQNYRKDSNKRVMAITGDTTVDLMWRLLNGAMPVTSNVKQVVLQIGSNNLLRQWFQVGC
ncbi:platelet-activating factor acetyltransferase activity protein [Trebouxia sp. C0009 RCD-2024]